MALVVAALVVSLAVKGLVLQVFFIPSGSMEPTLHGCPGCTGDRVLIDQVTYRVRDIRRGEVVVFDVTGNFASVAPDPIADTELRQAAPASPDRPARLGPEPGEHYIKRVVGVAGDRVSCCSEEGRVIVVPEEAGTPVELEEPYAVHDDPEPFCEAGRGINACPVGAEGVLVPDGRLWVMGDHRRLSLDSRAHMTGPGNGTVPVKAVVGRAVAIAWPPSRVGTLPVPGVFKGLDPV